MSDYIDQQKFSINSHFLTIIFNFTYSLSVLVLVISGIFKTSLLLFSSLFIFLRMVTNLDPPFQFLQIVTYALYLYVYVNLSSFLKARLT